MPVGLASVLSVLYGLWHAGRLGPWPCLTGAVLACAGLALAL